jgi:hypothetical protein
MAILLNRRSRVIVQGLTGKIGSFHADEMRRYGTNVVGGVTPGKGGQVHQGMPVFNTVRGAVRETGADASIVRAAALRSRLHHGGGRSRHQAVRMHHRRHSLAGHDAGEALHAALPL